MAAPTPVSALVHSRTLVTAGLILLFKFRISRWLFIKLILFIGMFTLFFARVSALYEPDVKKVVALRTLSQIGLSMSIFGLGLPMLAVLHLVSHGFFKRLLFLQVGYLIHMSNRQQDSRGYFGLRGSLSFVQLQMKVSLLSLSGLFFTNGMVTKDLLLEIVLLESGGLFFIFFYFIGVFFTFLYSFSL
jgi:NADH-ubiquinone oxidoreductase chain 5